MVAGGGNPFERDPAIVAKDVDRGLVTMQGARRYGVVLVNSTTIDEQATKDLRAQMRDLSLIHI